MSDVGNYIFDVQEKKERRRRYVRIGVLIGVVFAVLLVSAWFLFRAPFLRFSTIAIIPNALRAGEVSFDRRTSDAQVIDLLRGTMLKNGRGWLPIENFLAWPNVLEEKDLKFIPQLKRVRLQHR